MKPVQIGAALVGAMLSTAAMAGPYVGGSAVIGQRNYADLDDSVGGKGMIGYRFENVPLFIEASYLDTGDAELGNKLAKVSFNGFQFAGGVFGTLSRKGSGVWLKGGYYTGDAEGSAPGRDEEGSSSGASVGVGAVWKPTSWIGLHFEVENYFSVEDFVEDKDLTMFSAGLRFEIPAPPMKVATTVVVPAEPSAPVSSAPPAQVTAPALAPAPQPSVSAPAASPAPQVAPASASSPAPANTAPALASGAHRMRLLAEVPFRDSPKRTDAVKQVLPAGTELTLRNRVTNADGDWWFVQTDADIGWIPATQ